VWEPPLRLDQQREHEPLAQVRDLTAVLQPCCRKLRLGLAHPAQGALDPGALGLDERLDLAQRVARRHNDLHALGPDEDPGVARAL
jgi:hypothetical protein